MTRTSPRMHAIATAAAVPLVVFGPAPVASGDDPGVEIGPGVEVGSSVEIGPSDPYTLQPPPD